jgi:hypothetical protein
MLVVTRGDSSFVCGSSVTVDLIQKLCCHFEIRVECAVICSMGGGHNLTADLKPVDTHSAI